MVLWSVPKYGKHLSLARNESLFSIHNLMGIVQSIAVLYHLSGAVVTIWSVAVQIEHYTEN